MRGAAGYNLMRGFLGSARWLWFQSRVASRSYFPKSCDLESELSKSLSRRSVVETGKRERGRLANLFWRPENKCNEREGGKRVCDAARTLQWPAMGYHMSNVVQVQHGTSSTGKRYRNLSLSFGLLNNQQALSRLIPWITICLRKREFKWFLTYVYVEVNRLNGPEM